MEKPNRFYLPWIDWMKTIGIYLIVLGHFGADYSVYLYVFSVQLFFWISGFLVSPEIGGGWNSQWFSKLRHGLIVPMTLICLLTLCITQILSALRDQFNPASMLYFIPDFLAGLHTALINMWFVYTLIVLKVILHFSSKVKGLPAILLVIMPVIGYYINTAYQIESSALLNATMAYPFFYLGYLVRRYKRAIHEYSNAMVELITLIVCMAIVFLCGKYNGFVWMFCNEYGRSFALYILGGVAGTISIMTVSKRLSAIKSEIVRTISRGTILILGFHLYLIFAAKHLFRSNPLTDCLSAFLITLTFVPLIGLCERHFPRIIGKNRIRE